MFRQLEVFVCSSRESRTQKSELVNKCKCQKELWNTDQLENIEEKSLRRTSLLIVRIQIKFRKVRYVITNTR